MKSRHYLLEPFVQFSLRQYNFNCVPFNETLLTETSFHQNYAHDRDRWHTLVSAVMNLRVP